MKRAVKASVIFLVLALAISLLIFLGAPDEWRGNAAKDAQNTAQRGRASGPLRLNTANGLYFTDGSGKAVYLTGSHNWNNLQDAEPPFVTDATGWLIDPGATTYPKFDFATHLRLLVKENHNFTRLWLCEEAAWVPWLTRKQTIQPLPYARTGPGIALDGDPRFDLSQFNPDYFDRLRTRVSAAGDNGIYVSVMLFNGWSIETKGLKPMIKVWRGHPFNRNNNINGVDGDPNGDDEGGEVHTLLLPKITAIQEEYVRKTVTTLNDLDNVLWEISNESGATSKDWQYHMIDFIKRCEAGLPKQHPVGMTYCFPGGNNAVLFNSPADWVSPGKVEETDYCNGPPPGDGRKIIILDTDHLGCTERKPAWVWKAFTRGLNPIFMDPVERPELGPIRDAMGVTLSCANRMDMSMMRPRGDLASSGYCLANPGKEYLVYIPLEEPWLASQRFFHRFKQPIIKIRRLLGTKVTLDLGTYPGRFRVEWLNPVNGSAKLGRSIKGDAKISLAAPFEGDAVLYIQKEAEG